MQKSQARNSARHALLGRARVTSQETIQRIHTTSAIISDFQDRDGRGDGHELGRTALDTYPGANYDVRPSLVLVRGPILLAQPPCLAFPMNPRAHVVSLWHARAHAHARVHTPGSSRHKYMRCVYSGIRPFGHHRLSQSCVTGMIITG